jgi:hypothetical protein
MNLIGRTRSRAAQMIEESTAGEPNLEKGKIIDNKTY